MSGEQNQMIKKYLKENSEEKYGSFSAGLIPGGNVLGVRLPLLRDMAKQLAGGNWRDYLEHAVDDCMEETMLQGMTLGYIREPFSAVGPWLGRFIPKIDNWSVCDSTCASFKAAKREPQEVWDYLQTYLKSDQEFQVRFAVVMLLDHFILPEYIDEVLKQMDTVIHPGYYAKMAVAWNLSVCYIRFPEKTMTYLGENHLDKWTCNKAIQKMLESYRVSVKDKEILRTMKR